MSDQPTALPRHVPVTPHFIAEMEAKQATYAAQRVRYGKALEGHPTEDEPIATEPAGSFKPFNLARKRRVRSRREDPQQLSFTL